MSIDHNTGPSDASVSSPDAINPSPSQHTFSRRRPDTEQMIGYSQPPTMLDGAACSGHKSPGVVEGKCAYSNHQGSPFSLSVREDPLADYLYQRWYFCLYLFLVGSGSFVGVLFLLLQ